MKSRLEHSSGLERYQRSLDNSEPYFCHSVVQLPTGITHLQFFNRRGAAPVLLSWLLLHRHPELLSFKFKLSVTHFQVQLVFQPLFIPALLPEISAPLYPQKRQKYLLLLVLQSSPPESFISTWPVQGNSCPTSAEQFPGTQFPGSSRVHLSMQEEPGRASRPGAQAQCRGKSRAGVIWHLPFSQSHLLLWTIPFPY